MEAEHLVALEAALAELGGLYTAARNFVALETRADDELLPQLTALSARLRALHRGGAIGPPQIDEVSREILSLRGSWQAAFDEIRQSALFTDTCRAFERDDQDALATLIPSLFAGFERTAPPPRARFGISAAVRRRKAGTSPFLGASDCAEKLAATVRDGIVPRADGEAWWDTALPSIPCVAAPGDLETPFAVALPGDEITAAVFAGDTEIGYRIFTPRLRGDFVVEIAAAVDDEWWQAFELPFEEFRAELREQLEARGIAYTVVDID